MTKKIMHFKKINYLVANAFVLAHAHTGRLASGARFAVLSSVGIKKH